MANVFGALNRFISRLDADPQAGGNTPTARNSGYGFQVLRNTANQVALEPWFDFIIGINGRTIDNASPELFTTEIRNCAGSTISLGVFSAKGNQIREVFAPISPDTPRLGLSLQWAPLNVADDVWHILEVMPNSPADVAGLLPYSDYVIGSPENTMLNGEAALGHLVEMFMTRPLRLYVYNQEYDVTRVVTITPTRDWGGEGALGCVLGYGALHRIPAPLTEPSQGPGETLFDSATSPSVPVPSLHASPGLAEGSGSSFLVPADLPFHSPPVVTQPPPTSGPPPTAGKPRKARAHHAVSPGAGLDDYFAEGEQQSRELDRGTSSTPIANLRPPPRTGGVGPPPKATSPAPPPPAPSSLEEADGVD